MAGEAGLRQPTAFQQIEDGGQLLGPGGADGEAVVRVPVSVVRTARSSNLQTGNFISDNG
jgi:hypothetical protein